MLGHAPSRTPPLHPQTHLPKPAHAYLRQQWERSPPVPLACLLGLGGRGVPLPRKSPDLQSVSDALNAERAWTCAGRAAPGSRPDSQGGDSAVPSDSEPALGARPGLRLRTPGPVRGSGGSLQTHARPRSPPAGTGRLAPSPRAAPGPHRVPSVAVRASGAGFWPPSWAWGAEHPRSRPGAPPRGLEASVARQHRPPPRSSRRPRTRSPLPPAGRSSQPDLQPRDCGPDLTRGPGRPRGQAFQTRPPPLRPPGLQAEQARGLGRWPGMTVGRSGLQGTKACLGQQHQCVILD